MRHLPEEIWKNVFEYCEASTMLAVEETCREWRLVSVKYDEDIWKEKVKELWLKFEVNRPSSESVLERIQKLSTGKMVKMLRHIDLSRCIEKRDYQRMLLAKLVFEGRMLKELGGEDARFKGRYLSMFYPDWSLVIAPYKAAFFYTQRDTMRKVMHTSELCMVNWRFRFKDHPYAEGMTFAISFFEDGTSYSEMQQQNYSWRFIVDNGETKIQVEQFPPLTITRLLNGAWQLENAHVIISQLETIDPDSLPLL